MSVSGIRGLVGKTFTSSFCSEIAYLQAKYLGKGGIVVARDTRPTGPSFASAIFKGICAAGSTPLDIGIAPTPTACVAAKHFNAAGGVIITASHNPDQYNGYKMVHPSGRLFKGSECDEIYREFSQKNFPPADTMAQVDSQNVKKMDAITPHIDRILREVDVELIKRAHITVAIDSINGAAGVIFPRLLLKLGVAWVGVHNKIDGDFVHNPEPRPEHLIDLSNLMKKTEGLWGGFIFDPDADRLALMGEHGEPVTEEMTLVLACENILSRKPSPIATNLSTSMMVDDVARKYGVRVIRTKIGEANVVEGLLANGCSIGGEGNGGVIYPAISTVRDGLAGIALILELMAKTNKKVMELVQQWPSYPLVKEKIPCENNNPNDIIQKLTDLFKNETIDVQDGLKIVRDYGWVHIRPSNTEPIIRCYAEAKTIESAHQLVTMVIDKI
jgi:phosphoglucosamine mutase